MLIRPDHIARYWWCGGEFLALGGPLRLTGVASESSGCRVMPRTELEAIRLWHRGQMLQTTGAARHHHHLCLRDADAALADDDDVIDSHSRPS